jgi:hypothetical protein
MTKNYSEKKMTLAKMKQNVKETPKMKTKKKRWRKQNKTESKTVKKHKQQSRESFQKVSTILVNAKHLQKT